VIAAAGVRLVGLHLLSRRAPAALCAVAACAVGLRIALCWRWDDYGALQLPLIFETGCAATVAAATASPLGETERVTGRRLPVLRLAATLLLTVAAAGALAAAGLGAHLAGGTPQALRNLAGLIGVGLLGAVVVGGTRAWAGLMAYLMIGLYALYTQWHGPPVSTPWVWPARPSHDAGGALCASLIFAAGLIAVTVRGSRDPAGEVPH
jgi:hypothetical protein